MGRTRGFPLGGHERGMSPPHEPSDGGTPPPSGKRAATKTAAFYADHWRYVRHLLPSYGIPAEALKDLSQTVWTTAHERITSYDAAIHKTPRAWLTGIVRRCAANYRRTVRRRPEVLTEDPGALVAARGLNPEQAALLGTLRQAIPDEDRRETLILQVRHGLSIEEIAAATGATVSAVEWRLRMAKQELEDDDDDKKKSRAFLGFGSIEALAEALRPGPIPDEVGAEDWKEIAERIRQRESGERPDTSDSDPPTSTIPPPPVVPALAPIGQTAAALTLTKATLGGIVAAAFVVGAVAGIGGLLAWQAYDSARKERPSLAAPMGEAQAMEAPCPPTAASVTAAPPGSATSRSSSSSTATPPGSAASRSSTATPPGSSMRLILQMRHAAAVGNFAAVLTLTEEHARTFPTTDVDEREDMRRTALQRLGRHTDAGRSAP